MRMCGVKSRLDRHEGQLRASGLRNVPIEFLGSLGDVVPACARPTPVERSTLS
jgi:hypothetical protein